MEANKQSDVQKTETIVIKDVKIVFENHAPGKGLITISKGESKYSSYWGAMGGSIQEFMLRINEHYFTSNLLGARESTIFDAKKTFTELRRFIREDMDLPWYKHMEFQANLRENIKTFQEYCEDTNSERYFVDHFSFWLSTMPDFYLIENRFDRNQIQQDFVSISEPWHFIQTKLSEEAKWLVKLHVQIKKELTKRNYK